MKYKLKQYLLESYRKLLPPEQLTVSQWAEKYRILTKRSSARPGKWHNDMTPYLINIMNEINNYETETVVVVKPTQVGGTETIFNELAYVIDQDPSPCLIVYPTEVIAKDVSENRIYPMIESVPKLYKKLRDNSERMQIKFNDMFVALSYANSPSALASRPIKYLWFDETDKYPGATKEEADPISLAKERTKTFINHKIYMCSTPTIRSGHIWSQMEKSDIIYHYFIPCPYCEEFIELNFGNLKFDENGDNALYYCQLCGKGFNNGQKTDAVKKGKWQIVKENSKSRKQVAYWFNTLLSPFASTSFNNIAKQFLKSKDNPDELHNFVNSWLAEPWEETVLKADESAVFESQTNLEEFVVPEWAYFIAGGVDVQHNCIYWTITAYGANYTIQNIAHGQSFGWDGIISVMTQKYPKENSDEHMVIMLCLIDSGDLTDEVYMFCMRNRPWAYPCKGISTGYNFYRISQVDKAGHEANGLQLILVNGGRYKDLIAYRIKLEKGEGSFMFHNNVDNEYALQITAEEKIRERNKRGEDKFIWTLKAGRTRNHFLDCEIYAMAAADIAGLRTLGLKTKIKENEKTEADIIKEKRNKNNNNNVKKYIDPNKIYNWGKKPLTKHY